MVESWPTTLQNIVASLERARLHISTLTSKLGPTNVCDVLMTITQCADMKCLESGKTVCINLGIKKIKSPVNVFHSVKCQLQAKSTDMAVKLVK